MFNRDEAIGYIVANCSCYTSPDAREYLSKRSEGELQTIRDHVSSSVQNSLVANAAQEGFKDGDKEYKWDPSKNAFTVNCMEGDMPKKGKKGKKQLAANEDPEDEDEDETTTVNNRVLSFQEWMDSAPAEVQEVVSNARDITNQAKTGIVAKLVANVSDANAKKAKSAWLMSKPLNELKEMLSLLPAPAAPAPAPTVNYFGDVGTPPPVVNYEDDNPLVPPSFDYAELSKRR